MYLKMSNHCIVHLWNLVNRMQPYIVFKLIFLNKRSFLSAKVSLREGREWHSQNLIWYWLRHCKAFVWLMVILKIKHLKYLRVQRSWNVEHSTPVFVCYIVLGKIWNSTFTFLPFKKLKNITWGFLSPEKMLESILLAIVLIITLCFCIKGGGKIETVHQQYYISYVAN